MSRRSRTSTVGLLARHIGVRPGGSVLLSVIVGVGVLVTTLVPPAAAGLAERELQQELSATSPLRLDLTATGGLVTTNIAVRPDSAERILTEAGESLAAVPAGVASPLSEVLQDPPWLVQLPKHDAFGPMIPPSVRASIRLAVDLRWQDRVRFVEGTPPSAWSGSSLDDLDPESRPPLEIVLSSDAAEQLGISAGDLLSSTPAPLLVTGIYEPLDRADPYWQHAPEVLQGTTTRALTGFTVVSVSAFIDPASAAGLSDELGISDLRAWYPIDVSRITYAQSRELIDLTRELTAQGIVLADGELLLVQGGLTAAIERVRDRVDISNALLSLAASGPFGVLFAVFAVAVRTLLERRRAALALAAARGASALQLRGAMVLEALAISVPSGVIAVVAGDLLVPGPLGVGVLAIALVVGLAVPVLAAFMTSPVSLRATRDDVGTRRVGPTRRIAELAVVGLAVTAVVLLTQRGLVVSSTALGFDPLLSAAPLLLALATCVAVLRVYPLALLSAQGLARVRTGAVGLVGSARAVRDPAVGFAPMLAIVVGSSAAIFAVVMATTVVTGLAAATREETGGDVRIEARSLDSSLIQEVADSPGVADVAAIDVQPAVDIAFGYDIERVSVVFADTEALHRVRPDIAELDGSGDAPEFLASADVAERLTGTTTDVGGRPATLVGQLPITGLPDLESNWILMDTSAQAPFSELGFVPTSLLLSLQPGADIPSLTRELTDLVSSAQRPADVEEVTVTSAEALLAEAAARPTTGGLIGALGLSAALCLAMTVLTVALGSVSSSISRNRVVGILRMLGMTRRQLSRIVAWELAPPAIAAVLAGAATGLILPLIVTAVVDLRGFVGGSAPVEPAVPVLLVIAAVVGSCAVVIVTSIVSVEISRRKDPAATLRIGSE